MVVDDTIGSRLVEDQESKLWLKGSLSEAREAYVMLHEMLLYLAILML